MEGEKGGGKAGGASMKKGLFGAGRGIFQKIRGQKKSAKICGNFWGVRSENMGRPIKMGFTGSNNALLHHHFGRGNFGVGEAISASRFS